MNNILEFILRLRDEASAALRAYTQAAEQAKAASKGLKDSLGQIQKGLEDLGSSIGSLVGTASFTYFLKSAADTAFQAEAQMRVLQRTAEATGQDFDALTERLKAVLTPLGVLPEQAASAAAQLLRAGYTTEQIAAAFQAGAASALAAGKTAQQGIENIAMALSTGQSIYLNYIGISENLGPVLQKVASSMKGASEEAIRQAQNQAALNLVLKATAQEVDALPALLGGYAGAQNRLNLALYEFKKSVGEAVLPYLTRLTELATMAVQAFNSLDAETRRQVGTWAAFSGGVVGASTAIGLFLPVLRNMWTVLHGVGNTLLWLAKSPIALAVAGAGYLVAAWAKAGGDMEESRRRIGLIVQALEGLYYGARGTAEAVVGLFRNMGQTLAGIWAAITKAIRGDFAGAWQEVQKVLNLERWAANLAQANRDIVQAGMLLSSTWRGDVRPEAQNLSNKLQELAQKVLSTAEGAKGAAPAMQNLASGMAAAGDAAGKAAQKVKELDDATKSLLERAGRLTKLEQERRQPRDWSQVDVEGALLEAQVAPYLEAQEALLRNRAFENAMDRRMYEEGKAAAEQFWGAFVDQTNAFWSDDRALQATLNAIRRTASSFRDAVEQGVDLDLAARAFSEDFAEEVYKAADAAFTATAPGYADIGAMIGAKLLEGAEGSWPKFRESVQRGMEATARIVEEAARNQAQIIAKVMEDAEKAGVIDVPSGLKELLEAPIYAVLAAVRTGSLEASEGIQVLYEASDQAQQTLLALYQAGEITAEEFIRASSKLSAYTDAIAELRGQVLQSIGPIVDLGQAVADVGGDGDFAPALTAAMSKLDELRGYIDAIAQIEDPTERLQALADLEEWLAQALPGLEELIRALEEAGVDVGIVLERMEALRERMRELGQEARAVKLDQEAQQWARSIQDATNAVSGLHNALQGISDAFSAQTVGQGIASFARGVGGLVSLIPGGQAIGGLIGAVGGLIGWIWDGISSVFDTGWGKVQARINEAARSFRLISERAFQGAVEHYQESYLFGLIKVWKVRVNEEMMDLLRSIAGALEGGVLSGIKNAAIAFMRGARDWADTLRQSIREAIANAVVEAVIQGAVIKGLLGKLLDELTEALASGDMAKARAVSERILGAIPAVEKELEIILAPFKNFLAAGGAPAGTTAIAYQLPTVQMAAPYWVDEMGKHVASFGFWVDELVRTGIPVRVQIDDSTAYALRGAV